MKKLPLSVVISAGVHAFVVTAALAYEPAPRPDLGAKPANPIELVVVTEPEAVAVVLFDEVAEKLVATAEPAPTEPAMDRKSRVMRAVAARAGTAAVTNVPAEPVVTPGTRDANHQPHSMFHMRDKRVEVFSLMKLRNLERVPEGTKPVAEVPETGKLHPSGNGTHRSNEGVFIARVERDGSVSLKDARNLQIRWPDPRKIVKVPRMIGEGVASWYTQEDKTPKDPEREPINNKRPVEKDTRPDHGQTVPILGGGFDITDALMRRKKVDPYASKKLAYLDSTRDERVQIGNRYRKSLLAQSAELMQKQLDVVWTSTVSIQAKKQALFELWEDCAESGDAAVVDAGRAARALVIGFINAKFPKGSATAFTSAELAGLNKKRQSKATFEPYR